MNLEQTPESIVPEQSMIDSWPKRQSKKIKEINSLKDQVNQKLQALFADSLRLNIGKHFNVQIEFSGHTNSVRLSCFLKEEFDHPHRILWPLYITPFSSNTDHAKRYKEILQALDTASNELHQAHAEFMKDFLNTGDEE
ncbi:hypothetical protein [Acinetobacter johnsonii]|uniref:Uncharacterized protein n=1 Tax=Acinetobacter johnsonii TaxID=40214 RepID=A0A427UJA6_ACIJO|nr:hypothetical protein [Acinetobacter johnsonii]RSE16431.1 hypothetical protein EGT73_18110 [Acinetobacter johnsonii]